MNKNNKTIIIFDYKPSYLGLLNYLSKVWIFLKETIIENILEPPPGVDPLVFAVSIVGIIGQLYWLETPSQNIITKTLKILYQEIKGRWPCLIDLKESLEGIRYKFNDPRGNYLLKATDRIETLINTLGKNFAECIESLYFEKLIEPGKIIVFDLSRFGDVEKSLITQVYMLKIFLYRLFSECKDCHQIILWIDEAFVVYHFNWAKRQHEVWHQLTFFNQAREFNIGQMILTQGPGNIMPEIMNSQTIISFNLKNYEDKQKIITAMGIN